MAKDAANQPGGPRPVLRIGHSPDPDDAFMWWPLSLEAGRFDTGRFRYHAVPADIESLNERSLIADLEITAMSCAQYPHVAAEYALTACGASMGERYGPRIVARCGLTLGDLRRGGATLAVPGARTTAFLVANLMLGPGAFPWNAVPFGDIIARVAAGEFDAGIVIHEGQMTYRDAGLQLLCDLGEWWFDRHGLPLPLGVNAVRRDLDCLHGRGALREAARVLEASIRFALDHREEAISYAMQFARGVPRGTVDRFVSMYVTDLSIDCGERGRRAIETLLGEAARAGLAPDPGPIDLIRA
jgi:1,4-dihydroxy-6-naphthoate synthase